MPFCELSELSIVHAVAGARPSEYYLPRMAFIPSSAISLQLRLILLRLCLALTLTVALSLCGFPVLIPILLLMQLQTPMANWSLPQ